MEQNLKDISSIQWKNYLSHIHVPQPINFSPQRQHLSPVYCVSLQPWASLNSFGWWRGWGWEILEPLGFRFSYGNIQWLPKNPPTHHSLPLQWFAKNSGHDFRKKDILKFVVCNNVVWRHALPFFLTSVSQKTMVS